MKMFDVKQCALPDGPEAKMDYAKLATVMIERGGTQNGLSFAEMAERLDLRKKLKDAKPGEAFEITEGEISLLQRCAQAIRWSVMDEEIVEFGKYIESLATPAA